MPKPKNRAKNTAKTRRAKEVTAAKKRDTERSMNRQRKQKMVRKYVALDLSDDQRRQHYEEAWHILTGKDNLRLEASRFAEAIESGDVAESPPLDR